MAAQSKRPKSGDGAGRASKNYLILIADDAIDNRTIYSDYLEFLGYRVAQAKDGAEALVLAERLRPDLIVMDLSMPRVDGWSASSKLKLDPATQRIRILAVTGHAFNGSEERARGAGCDGYVRKPCLPEELESIIARMLAEA